MTTIREYLECIHDQAATIDGRNAMTKAAIIQRWTTEALELLHNSPIGITEAEYRASQGASRWRRVADPVIESS